MKMSTIITFGIAASLLSGLTGCLAGGAPGDAALLGSGEEAPELVVGEALASLGVGVDPAPAPVDVYIEDIATGGSGCPDPYTVSTLISSDRKSFLVIFDEMLLSYPPAPVIKNINCVAGVTLHVPNGWQFTIATVTTRGYAYLSNGIKARQTSKYFFAGDPVGESYHSTLYGNYDDQYSFTDEVGISSNVWSPCGGSAIFAIDTILNLNAANNSHGTAIFNTETLDGMFNKEFHWQWKPCSP